MSTRHKATRGARVTSYLSFGVGIIYIITAVVFHYTIESWPLTAFVWVSGVIFLIAGFGYMRVAKRNTEYAATKDNQEPTPAAP